MTRRRARTTRRTAILREKGCTAPSNPRHEGSLAQNGPRLLLRHARQGALRSRTSVRMKFERRRSQVRNDSGANPVLLIDRVRSPLASELSETMRPRTEPASTCWVFLRERRTIVTACLGRCWVPSCVWGSYEPGATAGWCLWNRDPCFCLEPDGWLMRIPAQPNRKGHCGRWHW
jgi:hypothetical protein